MTQTASPSPTAAQQATCTRKSKLAPAGAGGESGRAKRVKPDPESLPVVAWIGEDHEGRGAIVWEKTRGRARALAAIELDRDFSDVVSLRRIPALDNFTGNLRRWQLSHGWHWECQKCSKTCYGQEEGQDLDPSITTVMDEDDNVFCCPEHCAEYHAYWGMHRAIDAAILEDFKASHPGVVRHGSHYLPGHNDWYGWVDTEKGRVTVWEMVSVHRQHTHVEPLLATIDPMQVVGKKQ